MSTDYGLNGESCPVPLKAFPRNISEEQMRKFEGYMAEIFTAFGMDPDTAAPRRRRRAASAGRCSTAPTGTTATRS